MEEINNLKMETVREELKTRKAIAQNKRPSRLGNMGFGFGGEGRPQRVRGTAYSQRTPRMNEQSFGSIGMGDWSGSGLDASFGGGGFGSGMEGFGSGLDNMFGNIPKEKPRKGKSQGYQRSGLEDMFGVS